jgi:hypothetical protein
MSMSVSSTSFFQQDQNWFTSQSTATSQAETTAIGRLFGSSSASTSGADSLLGVFGTTIMNASTGAAVLAAQQASDRVNQQNAALKSGQPTTSALDVSSQVTFSGSLSANFGTAGPASAGGFQFMNGSALQAAVTNAFVGIESNGAPIDTVSVSGNTLAASTSGTNAHSVFTLTLKPDSGLYTLTLDNPIDLKQSKLDQSATLDLSGLVQAVQSDGGTIALPNSAVIQVHNGVGAASGTASNGIIHEGGLAYTGPDNTTTTSTTPTKPAAYTPPTNPLTGKAYVGTAAAAAATFGALNILS